MNSNSCVMLQSCYCDFQEEDSTVVRSSVFDISDIYTNGRRYCDFQEEDSTLVESSVFDISDIYPKWKTFVQRCYAANDSRLLNSLR